MSRESKERLFWLKISKISAKMAFLDWPKMGISKAHQDPRLRKDQQHPHC